MDMVDAFLKGKWFLDGLRAGTSILSSVHFSERNYLEGRWVVCSIVIWTFDALRQLASRQP
jgi:hypothetical protein